MNAEIVQGFIKQAEEFLPTIRGGILAGARTGNAYGELNQSLRQIEAITAAASVVGANKIVEICAGFEQELRFFTGTKSDLLDDEGSRRLLDKLAEMEILLAEIYFGTNNFSDNVESFVDESFERFQINRDARQTTRSPFEEEEEFEIDEEMLEIFALEAEDLVRRIGENLEVLEQNPQNGAALLEIRRAAHTLKGSAGIVGLKKLAHLAHCTEDLLECLTTNEIGNNAKIFASLLAAIDCFAPLARQENSPQLEKKIERIFADFDDIAASFSAENLSGAACGETKSNDEKFADNKSNSRIVSPDILKNSTETRTQQNAPAQNRSVVRVSLEKIDEIVKIAGVLAAGGEFLQKRIAELEQENSDFRGGKTDDFYSFANGDLQKSESLELNDAAEFYHRRRAVSEARGQIQTIDNNSNVENVAAPQINLETLLEAQRGLIEEMQEKLRRLRMVSFGTLAARLQRTARATCEEEEKSAELFIAGDALEIDTQILDSLVEPLLHLLRNAVAHGIEAPELRRLLGKPETGRIDLHIFNPEADKKYLVVTVADDGRGISADALREKAIAGGFVSRERAGKMTDAEAFELIFLPGLTTAEKLSQVAGRGVGMNVVKTVVEQRHGKGAISISSQPLKGTTFTLRLSLEPETESLKAAAKRSVLIVDDSPSVRRATSNLLKNAGWQPFVAADGLEALKVLQRLAEKAETATIVPDVILTDAEMPQMDGCQLLAALKRHEIFRAIPVIMITSRADEEYRRKAAAAGVSAYLTKPCDEDVLLKKIEQVMKVKSEK